VVEDMEEYGLNKAKNASAAGIHIITSNLYDHIPQNVVYYIVCNSCKKKPLKQKHTVCNISYKKVFACSAGKFDRQKGLMLCSSSHSTATAEYCYY